ncbi:MAG TPA: hypothetical protein VFX16_22770 [Pseudonocardiaceae bacterium]|nr:hypothetical protein [Pseudonocardiaceae bacterium]
MPEHSVPDILAAAPIELSDPVDLGGNERTTVLRCRTTDGTTVVVKAHHNRQFFAAEAAGLEFTTHGPRLLAVNTDLPLLVMTDLGTAPSLADRLLDTSADIATTALLDWATGYGRIAAETFGRAAEFDALRAGYGDNGTPTTLDTTAFSSVLTELGITPPDGLATDLATVTALNDNTVAVFSPGDICPDNNLLTADGLRVLDFEGAGYHSVYLDAAYTTMPFATCWCVFALPDGLAARIETAYRAEVAAVCPELADDTAWRSGMRLATAWWTVDITAALGGRAATRDLAMHPARTPVPTVRQLLRHRWSHLLAVLDRTGALPALAETTRRLLLATEVWPVDPLPRYPAFG